jgi:glycosyltransferase involved in cell wall biosynthesis
LVYKLIKRPEITSVDVVTLQKKDGKTGKDGKHKLIEWKYPRKDIDNYSGRRLFLEDILLDVLKNFSDNPVDIIHVHDWDSLFMGWLLESVWGKPLVMTVHRAPTEWQDDKPTTNAKDCFMEAVKRTSILTNLVVPSQASKDVLTKQGFGNVQVIPHGVTPNFGQLKYDDSVLAEIGVPKERKIILCPVRADEHKTPEVLVYAAPRIKSENAERRPFFVFLSDWDEKDSDKHQVDLRRMAEDRGLKVVRDNRYQGDDDVLFLPQIDFGEKLSTVFRRSSIVVIPSVHESFGQSVLDAFACKRPVVANNSMALKELIRTSQTGLLFDSSDKLATQVGRLLTNDDLYKRIVQNAYKELITKYSVDTMANMYVEYYKSLIK